MAIHENLARVPKQQLREISWTKATEVVNVARREEERFEIPTQPGCTWPRSSPKNNSSSVNDCRASLLRRQVRPPSLEF